MNLEKRVERLETQAQTSGAVGDPPDCVSVYDAGAGGRVTLTWPQYQKWQKNHPSKDTIIIREVIPNEQDVGNEGD